MSRRLVSQTLPLKDLTEAHRQIETHHTRSKIALKLAPENNDSLIVSETLREQSLQDFGVMVFTVGVGS